MEENHFSEKESLALISQMIKQTQQNMKVGSGNILLYYGYPAVVIAVVVYFLVCLTHNQLWASLWFMMFIPSVVLKIKSAGQCPEVVTYMDKAVGNTWSVIGSLFLLSVIGIGGTGYLVGSCNFALMLPLSLLYAGIGVAITGVITRFSVLVYTPLLAFVIAIYMLVSLAAHSEISALWHLLFGVSFLVMMVIPGHILNHKSLQSCSKS